MTDDSDDIHEYHFVRLQDIDLVKAKQLRGACLDLAKLGDAGRDAADRIYTAGEDIAIFTPSNLQAFIDVDGTSAEVEHEQLRSIQWVAIVRNVSVLLPLLFTWLGLSWAASQYALDLSTHPNDKSLSFLQLWEEGFGTRNPIFSFSHFAAVDVGLFVFLIAIGLYADIMTRRARQAGTEARNIASRSFKSLAQISVKMVSGVNAHTSNQEWAAQVHQALLEIRTVVEHMKRMRADDEPNNA